MIPNTDINCGKCATPIYSDCVMWSGQNLSCVTLLQDCCDTTLTKVIELLGGYVCNLSNVANYNIPVCMDSYNITDFIGMQNAMMDLICQQSEINVTGLTWGCTPSGTTTLLQDTIQAVIDEVNTQSISYSTDYFTVTNTETCPPKNLTIKQGVWTDVDLNTVTFYNQFSGYTGASYYGLQYMIEPATNTVRLRGLLYRPVMTDWSSGAGIIYGGYGVGILVCDIPIPGIIPAVTTPTDYKDVPTFAAVGFNNTCIYGQNASPSQHYNLVWNIVISNNGAGALRIAAYVPYSATVDGGGTSPNRYVSFYLHPVHYTLN